MDLYRFQDGKDKIFYFEREDGTVVSYSKNNVASEISNLEKQSRALYAQVEASENAKNDVRIGDMNEEDFIKLVEDYHDDVCTDGSKCNIYSYDTKGDRSNTKFTIFGGLGYGF